MSRRTRAFVVGAAHPGPTATDFAVRLHALDLFEAFGVADMTRFAALQPGEVEDAQALIFALVDLTLDMLGRWSTEPLVDVASKRLELLELALELAQQTGA